MSSLDEKFIIRVLTVTLIAKRGSLKVEEFYKVMNKIIDSLRSKGLNVRRDWIFHILDLINESNGLINLSEKGIRYLEILNDESLNKILN
ncbi:MAG: hypothetical protein B6V02_02905 [Thermoprotei archaeon ex4572_64]|nr:MAG: hypothetical protein B6V02_02905 [Thermoprotei archaeon ex4572_64]